jgi:hypothetical protein
MNDSHRFSVEEFNYLPTKGLLHKKNLVTWFSVEDISFPAPHFILVLTSPVDFRSFFFSIFKIFHIFLWNLVGTMILNFIKGPLFLVSQSTVLWVLPVPTKWASRTALLRGHCSLNLFHILVNWKLIRTMMSIFKRPLFLVSKSTIVLFLILAAGVTLVIATSKQPKFRASSMYSSQSNSPVQPSGPNPCSFLPGSGHCKPPKWFMFHA